MYQVPIEDVLEEFRKKYSDYDKPVQNATEPAEVNEPNEVVNNIHPMSEAVEETFAPIYVSPRKNHITFRKIITIQSITASIIIALMIALRLFNPGIYQYISELLRARL